LFHRGTRVWAKVPLTRRARRQRRGAALAPLKPRVRRRFRTLLSHCLLPLALTSRSPSSFASAVPPLLALPAHPRLRRHDVELDTLQRFSRAASTSRRGGAASSTHRRRRFPATSPCRALLLMVDYRIKVHMDLQADKSPVVVKGPFFPQVVNPRYRIRRSMCNARIQSSKARKAIL
jgi:hypothetical protein